MDFEGTLQPITHPESHADGLQLVVELHPDETIAC
jgi:hypothetical protein